MTVAQVLAAIDGLAPPALAEEWDNVGLIVGRRDRLVARVLVALEMRVEVLDEARERGCEAVLTHHPLIFPALARLTDDTVAAGLALRAAEEGIAVLAAHTNLDAARGGLNDAMAGLLGMTGTAPLRPAAGDPAVGLGRVGAVTPATLGRLAAHVARAFGGAPVTHSGDPDRPVARVACCTGSGASLIPDARAAGADAYVTSDLKHHDADRAEGLAQISLPHARAEQVTLALWARDLEAALAAIGVEMRLAAADTDPWSAAPV